MTTRNVLLGAVTRN